MTAANTPRHVAGRHRANSRASVGAPWLIVLAVSSMAAAQPPAARETETEATATGQEETVVARVNNRVVYAAEVEEELRDVLGPRTADASTIERLRAEVTARLIDRQLVVEWLESRDLAATEKDVDLAVQRLEEQLTARGRTLAGFLSEKQISLARLRARMLWSLSWRRLLDRYLTDENRQRYFEQHRRDFDGTRLHVAHILWKVEEAAEQEAKLKQATEARAAIEAGMLSFAEAAKEYSDAPTAAQGGDIGWIERREPMPESFTQAAFGLDVGQTSAPVTTSSGVHLIHCLAIEPGQRSWQEARRELDAAIATHLFQWAAEKQRPAAKIERVSTLPPSNERGP